MPSEAAPSLGAQAAMFGLRPDWAAPPAITALMSTRHGGVSQAPFDSLNLRPWQLGGDAADAPQAVLQNQRRFATALGATPLWLNQVHGAGVIRLTEAHLADQAAGAALPVADASVTTVPGLACTVLVADCLPLLLCSPDGRAVGAAHAGWRGLAAGVIEACVAALSEAAGCAPRELQVWLGPCIGPQAFEVGGEVLQAFGADPTAAAWPRFVARLRPDGAPRWLADLPGLARDRLHALGIERSSGGTGCTVSDGSRFFSHRRDGAVGPTGRMAAAIAIRGR